MLIGRNRTNGAFRACCRSLFKTRTTLSQAKVIYSLGCKGKLCNNIFSVIKIAIEGIVFCGNVNAIIASHSEPIVFNVKAVRLQGSTVNNVILTVVMPFQNKSVLGIVSKRCFAKLLKIIATGH